MDDDFMLLGWTYWQWVEAFDFYNRSSEEKLDYFNRPAKEKLDMPPVENFHPHWVRLSDMSVLIIVQKLWRLQRVDQPGEKEQS